MNKDLKLTYILLAVLILVFVFNPFMNKIACKNVNADEYLLLKHFLITIFIIIYAIYLFCSDNCDIKVLKKMSRRQVFFAIIGAFTSIIGSIVFIKLIQTEDITFLIPNIQPLVIMISAIIGYFLFNEPMYKEKIFGIILIILGAFALNYKKISKTPINNARIIKNTL